MLQTRDSACLLSRNELPRDPASWSSVARGDCGQATPEQPRAAADDGHERPKRIAEPMHVVVGLLSGDDIDARTHARHGPGEGKPPRQTQHTGGEAEPTNKNQTMSDPISVPQRRAASRQGLRAGSTSGDRDVMLLIARSSSRGFADRLLQLCARLARCFPCHDATVSLIPREAAAVIARRFGADGEAFIERLPAILAAATRKWNLTIGESLPMGIGGYLVGAADAHGREVVLKLSPTGECQRGASEREAYALTRWQGRGAARLLDADLSLGALLLERCVPGTTIDTLTDSSMIMRGCQAARCVQLTPSVRDRELLPSALETTDAYEWPSVNGSGLGLSQAAVIAIDQAREFVRTASEDPVLCHGDLNPGNLISRGDAWVAIDPMPILAPPSYDAASLVWCKRTWLLGQPDPAGVLARRIHRAAGALGAECATIRAWTLVRLHALLAERAVWGGYDDEPFLRVADYLATQHR